MYFKDVKPVDQDERRRVVRQTWRDDNIRQTEEGGPEYVRMAAMNLGESSKNGTSMHFSFYGILDILGAYVGNFQAYVKRVDRTRDRVWTELGGFDVRRDALQDCFSDGSRQSQR